jgi:argonaute family protein
MIIDKIINTFSSLFHSEIEIVEKAYEDVSYGELKKHINSAIDENTNGIITLLEGVNPHLYYKLKSYFLTNGVPSQFIRYDKIASKDGREFEYYLNNASLQLFAKLGGKPWKIYVDPEKGSDIIIGTGATRVDSKNVFCFAMIFKKDGTLAWNEVSPLVDSSNYETQLKRVIVDAIDGFKESNPDWDLARITLHISSKRPKQRKGEANIIEDALSEMKGEGKINSDTKYCILHVSDSAPFWILGPENPHYYHPPEGIKVRLNSKRYLISITHPYKPHTPISPLSVEIVNHNWMSEEFGRLSREVINEVYYLSKMNWRGFKAKNTPVTTDYPKLVAKLIGSANQYGERIRFGEEHRKLQTTPWFL